MRRLEHAAFYAAYSLVYVFLGWMYWLASARTPSPAAKPPSVVRCAACGGAMRVVEVTFAPRRVLSEHALAYLDSG